MKAQIWIHSQALQLVTKSLTSYSNINVTLQKFYYFLFFNFFSPVSNSKWHVQIHKKEKLLWQISEPQFPVQETT
jgi:hypothetical protein